MTNVFFLSPGMNFCIEHIKVTAKFDNANKGKLRLAMRVILKTKKEIKEELKFFLLIKNGKDTMVVERIEEQYNRRLSDPNFRIAAGLADRFTDWMDKGEYIQFKITESFKEREGLAGNDAIFPKSLKCESSQEMDLPEDLRKDISKKDIIIEVIPKISLIQSSTLLVFQFAFVLDKFVDEDTLSKWVSSGKVWSVNFDFHERIGYEDLFETFNDFFTYPESFELWIYIPKGHYPIASSPPYRKAFPLGAFETSYRVTRKEFETDEGDMAVQIMNKSGKPERFSIICISPYIAEEKLREVEEKIEKIPTWRDFLQNMVLTVAIFSLLIGVIVILAQQALQWTLQIPIETTERPPWQNFPLLVEISIFMGFSFWGVHASLKIIAEKFRGFEFLAYIGLIMLGSLGISSQIFRGQDFIKASIILISVLFILFGLIALIIRSLRK
ncbi:MAG: hypothetical protein HXS48_16555 [Theionarchaea archaeon]|nr:hypothetical protein [Theionarchaea archaeon]